MKSYERIYYVILYSLYISYILIFTGFQLYDLGEYIHTLNIVIRLYVCAFLLYRFNPFQSLDKFSEFDRIIVFSSAMFLLFTICATQINEFRSRITNESETKYLAINNISNDSI
jgi:hypothetical protein